LNGYRITATPPPSATADRNPRGRHRIAAPRLSVLKLTRRPAVRSCATCFTEDRGGYFEDVALLDLLVTAKLGRERIACARRRAGDGRKPTSIFLTPTV